MIKVDYILQSIGWADCTIRDDSHSVTISASYLSDALGDLLSAVLKLINGEKEVYSLFSEEPGEYRWIFKLEENNIVKITILDFLREIEGENIFETECTLKEIAASLFQTTAEILKQYGLEGYKKKWNIHEFPLEQYNALNQWLTSK